MKLRLRVVLEKKQLAAEPRKSCRSESKILTPKPLEVPLKMIMAALALAEVWLAFFSYLDFSRKTKKISPILFFAKNEKKSIFFIFYLLTFKNFLTNVCYEIFQGLPENNLKNSIFCQYFCGKCYRNLGNHQEW